MFKKIFTCRNHGRSPSVAVRWLCRCQVKRQSFQQQLPVTITLSLVGLGPQRRAGISTC